MAPWIVELYETEHGNGVEREMGKLGFTVVQRYHIGRQLERLEKFGRGLDADFFRPVRGSKRGLEEFRLSADRVEPRFLFSFERPATFLMLVCYKEKGDGAIPSGAVLKAERRLRDWRLRHPNEA